ncbi:MAG: hypothetical protein AB7S26_30350, partial [Sandaracinaceae bacterium]
LKNRFAKLEQTAGADAVLEQLKRVMGLIADEAPAVTARVAVASAEEEMDAEEMAELEAALEELKRREEMAKG